MANYKTYCSLFVFILLVTFTSKAQIDYTSGFLVSTQNDTIHGLIKKQLNSSGYDLLLKQNETATAALYKPTAIVEYYLSTGALYEARQVFQNNNLITVFLQCHVRGLVSLYSYVDASMFKHYYIKNSQGEIRELLQTEERKYRKSKKAYVIHTNKRYIAELMIAFGDCPSLRASIEQSNLALKSLSNLTIKYHECVNARYIAYLEKKEKDQGKLEFGALFGVNRRFKTDDIQGSDKTGLGVSPFIKFYLPNSSNRFSIEARVNIAKVGLDDELINTITLPVRLNKYFPQKNSQAVLSLGIDFPGKNAGRLGGVVGLGYEFKLAGIRLISNVEYRLVETQILTFNIGVGF